MLDVRKVTLSTEEVHHERGPRLEHPLLVGTAIGVVRNPYAGRYEDDLLPFMAELRSLGSELAARLIGALGGVGRVESYGKGAIVGGQGELEHGALWHEAGGWAMRSALGDPLAMVPSAKTVGAIGTRLMVPLGHINAAYVRSHYGTASMSVWDAPRSDEIVYGLAMATGPRPHARIGGLAAQDIKGVDGLR